MDSRYSCIDTTARDPGSIALVVTTRAELLVVLKQAFDLRARRKSDALAAD